MSAPEWLTVGARVASVSGTRFAGRRIRFAKVDRIGNRDVVLDDGQRFNVTRLSRTDGGAWGTTTVLMSADDPRVAEWVEEIRRDRLVTSAKVAADNFRLGKIQAFEAILALAPLTGVEAEIRALFGEQP